MDISNALNKIRKIYRDNNGREIPANMENDIRELLMMLSIDNKVNNTVEESERSIKTINDISIRIHEIAQEIEKDNKNSNKSGQELIKLLEKGIKEEGLLSEDTMKRVAAYATMNDHLYKTIDKIRIEAKLNREIDKGEEEKLRKLRKEEEYYDSRVKKIREGLTLEEEYSHLLTMNGEKMGINTDKFKKGIEEIKKGINEVSRSFKSFYNPWSKIDQAAADYTKRLGGTAQGLVNFREAMINAQTMRHIGDRYNVSMEELAMMQSNYGANIGRKINFTNRGLADVAAIHAVAGENGEAIAQNLENYGFDIGKSGDLITKMFKSASQKGIAFEKVAKNFQEHIKMAQTYTFADGIRGVERMAERSAALKLNMQQTSAFAEKVSSLEGALRAGAGLSVLGGSFARNSNPLAMMYEGLNDAEGLQERTIRMIESLGHFDKTKNQLDVSAFNRMRIKAMAEQTGMDYANLMESANAIGRRKEVESQIRGLYGGDNELAELVKNTAQLDENGNAYVTISGEKKSVRDITAADKGQLKVNANTQEDNIRDIAQNLRGMRETVEGIGKQREGLMARAFNKIGDDVKKITQWFGSNNLMVALTAAPDILNAILGTTRMIHATMLMGKAFGGTKGFATPAIVGQGKGYGIGGNFGKKWGVKESINGAYTDGRGTFFRGDKGYRRGRLMQGFGSWKAGLGMGLAGAGIGYVTDKAHENGERKGWGYALGKTSQYALEGAALGSMFGPWGTLIGGAVGLGVGAYKSFKAKALDDKKAAIEQATGYWLNGDYTSDELDAILNHRVNGVLRSKMAENGDTIPGYRRGGIVRKNFKNGTNSVTGPGTSTSDSIPAMLSAGEAVVSVDNLRGNKMTISAINNGGKLDKNLMDIKKVAHTESAANSMPKNITFKPLEVKVGGTIKLDYNGKSADLDVSKLLNNQQFINEVSKLIMREMNFGYRKEDATIKYGYTNR